MFSSRFWKDIDVTYLVKYKFIYIHLICGKADNYNQFKILYSIDSLVKSLKDAILLVQNYPKQVC